MKARRPRNPTKLPRRTPLAIGLGTRSDESLAALMAFAISAWAMLEIRLGWVLAKLLGAKATSGVAMLKKLNADQQLIAIENVAKIELRGADLLLFRVLLKRAKVLYDERNAIAHGMWATTGLRPNMLFLLRGKSAQEWLGKLGKFGNTRSRLRNKLPPRLKTEMMEAYDEARFRSIIGRIRLLDNDMQMFFYPKSRKDSSRAEERRRLRQEPEIQSEMLRLENRMETTRKVRRTPPSRA